MIKADCRLIVFAKAPVSGKVKTRLIPAIGARAATALYEKMVSYCLTSAIDAGVGPVDLWCAPSMEHPFFARCGRRFQLELHTQPDGDLGQRMAHAFSETLKISTCVLLMGSDCPGLTCDDLREAKALLQEGADAVICPAEDGGYVLLGLRRFAPELFSGILWGTESVLEQTRTRLRRLEWRWQELSERWDVDRPEDLQRLMSEGYFNRI